MSDSSRSARRRFEALLGEIFEHPERRDGTIAEIERIYARDCAVLVLDTSGFTRTTRKHGIYAFLLMVHQMKRLARPIVEAHAGTVVKEEADNLFCLFPTCAEAVAAAERIVAALDAVNPDLPEDLRLYASIGIAQGRILDLAGEDLYGDAVNLACKLGEDLAQRGEILITEDAFKDLGVGAGARQAQVSISGLSLTYRVLRAG
ncbi:MAG TPA: adenylate/guanylate cyclase domain-containing protein [Novosphingobium sp.]|nr:adenylate/guanylate cyclase domain-containing protein [Novosphingobium sp.]